MQVEISIEEPLWAWLNLQTHAERAVGAVTDALEIQAALEISILACDDTRIASLNGEFRDKAGATNVLSWPASDRAPAQAGDMPNLIIDDPEVGDIAIAYQTCAREAEVQGLKIEDHVTHLLVHGVLHLLGFDHIDDQDAATMEALETQILAKLGVDDPYRD